MSSTGLGGVMGEYGEDIGLRDLSTHRLYNEHAEHGDLAVYSRIDPLMELIVSN